MPTLQILVKVPLTDVYIFKNVRCVCSVSCRDTVLLVGSSSRYIQLMDRLAQGLPYLSVYSDGTKRIVGEKDGVGKVYTSERQIPRGRNLHCLSTPQILAYLWYCRVDPGVTIRPFTGETVQHIVSHSVRGLNTTDQVIDATGIDEERMAYYLAWLVCL